MNQVHVLINPSVANHHDAVIAYAKRLGFLVTVLSAGRADEVPDVINAAKADIERLIIVGGDGLIHLALPAVVERVGGSEVAGAGTGSGIDIGIVPVGTGNDFARALGLGRAEGRRLLSPAKRRQPAMRQALLGVPEPVDVLVTDGDRWAATVITAGFSGRVTARANPMRFPPGQARYTVATLVEASRLEPIEVALTTPDGRLEVRALFIAVGNTRYFGGGMAICPAARFDDGQLDITIVADVPVHTLLRVLPEAFAGTHVRHDAVTTLQAPWIKIETDEPLWADGEPFGTAPTRIEARPGALRVARQAP